MSGALRQFSARKPADTFSPSDLTGIAAWWEADTLEGALTDGDPVSTWQDQHTNGVDVTEASTTRPTFKTNVINGKPALRFTAAQHLDGPGGLSVTVTQPFTLLIVCASDGTGTGRHFVLDTDSGDNATRSILVMNNSSSRSMYSGSFVNGGAADTSWHSIRSLHNGASSTLHVDGTQEGTGDAGARDYRVDTICIARENPGAGNDDNFAGDIALIAIVNGEVSGQDLTDWDAYVAARYGL